MYPERGFWEKYFGPRRWIMEKYGFKDRGEVLGLIEKIEGEDGAEHIRNMVAFFFEAAKQGDKPARDYCEKMAIRGAQLISALSNELDFGDGEVEVVLSGSIHTKLPSEIYLKALMDKAVMASGRKLSFIKLFFCRKLCQHRGYVVRDIECNVVFKCAL